jgi:hypothetical protein
MIAPAAAPDPIPRIRESEIVAQELRIRERDERETIKSHDFLIFNRFTSKAPILGDWSKNFGFKYFDKAFGK